MTSRVLKDFDLNNGKRGRIWNDGTIEIFKDRQVYCFLDISEVELLKRNFYEALEKESKRSVRRLLNEKKVT